jgi:hypothetical protein
MSLSPGLDTIQSSELLHNLADVLFNHFVPRWSKRAKNEADTQQGDNIERNIDDALVIFEKLQIGLDINVKFSACRDFEYTRELDIFDLFSVNLYHGWLIDPQQEMFHNKFVNKSYNQLVEMIFLKNENKPGEDDNFLTGELAENFLEQTASQLTYFGLSELHAEVKPNELCVLFRNNHFSTMYKSPEDKKLYLLVTDQGYLRHSSVVWETLDNIEGDATLCDAVFRPVSADSIEQGGKGAQCVTDLLEDVDESCKNE